jgi:hypothetical protein
MQCVSWLISAFPSRCGWAWTSFATQHKCASKSAITWRLSFSGYLTARHHHPPLPFHSAHLRGRKMVWEASIMVAGRPVEGGVGPANSTTSRMAAVGLFGLVFIQIYLWYIGPYSFPINCDTPYCMTAGCTGAGKWKRPCHCTDSREEIIGCAICRGFRS